MRTRATVTFQGEAWELQDMANLAEVIQAEAQIVETATAASATASAAAKGARGASVNSSNSSKRVFYAQKCIEEIWRSCCRITRQVCLERYIVCETCYRMLEVTRYLRIRIVAC